MVLVTAAAALAITAAHTQWAVRHDGHIPRNGHSSMSAPAGQPRKCQLYSEDINQRGKPCPPDLRWSTKHVYHGTLGLAVLLMPAVVSGKELLGCMRSKRHGKRGVCARAARGGVHRCILS